MNKRLWVLCVLVLSIGGCAAFPKEPLRWSAGVVAPQHYDVWVDHFGLETTGARHWRVPAGYVSCCWKEPYGKGGGRYSVSPPNYFLIRWYSFAERKRYGKLVELPNDLEDLMQRKRLAIWSAGNTLEEPLDTLVVGLAPGGQIVVWVMNRAENAKEILRTQAVELEAEPHYPVWQKDYDAEHGDYIRKHGIQYEGW